MGAIKNLREEAELVVLMLTIEDFISLGEFQSVFFVDGMNLENFVKSFNAHEEVPTS